MPSLLGSHSSGNANVLWVILLGCYGLVRFEKVGERGITEQWWVVLKTILALLFCWEGLRQLWKK